MPISKKQRRKRAAALLRAKPRQRTTRTGSRLGDDLIEAFEQMAAHMRGEVELEDVSRQR
jgi:hypothetical protein